MSITTPTTQKALFIPSKHAAFTLGATAVPKPGPGQLLIRNEAVALNPADWKIQVHVWIDKFPLIVGLDLAGVVAEVGQGMDGSAVGDRVISVGYPLEIERGGYQESTIITASFSAKIPKSISFDQAASVPLGIFTAAVGLYEKTVHGAGFTAPWEERGRGKYSGKPILVFGGSSSVGSYVIQLAKLSGFSNIIATASPQHTGYLLSLGATHVVDRHLDLAALRAAIAEIGPVTFDVIYDAISTDNTQKAAASFLAPNGALMLVLPSVLGDLEDGKQVKSVLGSPFHSINEELLAGLCARLEGWLETGDVQPNRVEVLTGGLGGVAGGLDRLRGGTVSGVKLVVRPQETA